MSRSTTNFEKEVRSKLNGENTDSKVSKIARKCVSGIEGQIAALKGKQIDDENAVEDANERLNSTIYPTELPTDNKKYCLSIVAAQAALDEAKEQLELTKESIKYFNELLEKF